MSDNKFKNYVHARLDAIGIPADPYPDQTEKTGCRIGSRLDCLFRRIQMLIRPDFVRAMMTLERDEAIHIYRCPMTQCIRVSVNKGDQTWMTEIPYQAIVNDDLEKMIHAIEHSLRKVRENARPENTPATGRPVPKARFEGPADPNDLPC